MTPHQLVKGTGHLVSIKLHPEHSTKNQSTYLCVNLLICFFFFFFSLFFGFLFFFFLFSHFLLFYFSFFSVGAQWKSSLLRCPITIEVKVSQGKFNLEEEVGAKVYKSGLVCACEGVSLRNDFLRNNEAIPTSSLSSKGP